MQICYLLAFPDSGEDPSHPPDRIKGLKDAPYFQPVDISVLALGYETLHVEGLPVTVSRQRFDGLVQLLECRFELEDALAQNSIQHRQRIEAGLQALLVPEAHRQSGLFEEYVVLLVRGGEEEPDAFIARNAQNLARFLRLQREVLDLKEIEDTLVSRVRYSQNEMTVIDWEGAVIISPDGDFQSDIELLKIGNYQILRYRILDRSIDESLREINRMFKQHRRGFFGLTRNSVKRIVNHRLELMLDFEHTSQNLLLIGDWYTAKLYTAIQDEFYLVNWKQAVQEKLDNLEAIIETIQENFSLSWSGLLANIELAGWILLLIGYFVLFFMEEILAR